MSEDNPENIMQTPTWPLMRDGLGSTAMIVGSLPTVSPEGEEIIKLIIKVDDFIKKKYNLKPKDEYNEQNNMRLIVKKIDMIPLNPYDTSNQVWQYVKTFKHESTELSKREDNLKTIINVKDKRILLLEAENIRLNEQILLFRTNPAMAAAQGAEVFEKTAKVMADMMRPQQKGEQ
jgi:hypothetical protein